MDAERARFVAGCRDDTALIGPATDYYGFTAEIGALEEFHGDEESVHVHVEDGGVKGKFTLFGGFVFSAEASEVRHGSRVRLRSGRSNEAEVSCAARPDGVCGVAEAVHRHCNEQINQIF
jgi:hypothetical protein